MIRNFSSLPATTQRNITKIKEKWEYYKGEFRQHWIGLKPDEGTEIGRKNSEAIDRLFQSVNIVAKLVDYHVDALIGNEPAIAVEGDERESLDDLVRDIWRNWIASQGDDASDPVTLAVTRAKATGYGYLRVWTPDRMSGNELAKQVAIHAPTPESVFMSRDDNSFIDKIYYYYEQDKERWIEAQYINENGLTVFEYYRSTAIAVGGQIELNPTDMDRTFALDLKGRYTVYEIRLKEIVTDGMKRNQNAINHGLTMIPRGNELSGFLARFFSNARPPGRWMSNPDGTTSFEPDPDGMVIGAGIVNFISGLPIKDVQGNTTGYTNVGVHTDPPMPIDSFEKSFQLFSEVMHLQANQGHLLNVRATMSGRSREELKADFITAVNKDAIAVESAINNSLGVAIALLALPGATPTVTARLKLNFGKPTPEERRAILEVFQAGLMSKQSAIAMLGYSDDPLAELELIQSEGSTNTQASE